MQGSPEAAQSVVAVAEPACLQLCCVAQLPALLPYSQIVADHHILSWVVANGMCQADGYITHGRTLALASILGSCFLLGCTNEIEDVA